ncbi:MAG: dihydroorotase [Ignavibacteriales bacterium]|nr:MAG: dihydroorotase [Ignavibacteriales bacterium]
MDIYIKNAHLLDPVSGVDTKDGLLIKNGIITAIGPLPANESGIKVWDVNGALVVPGLMDMHIHLREPGREDEETITTGSDAAAAGGFTAVACMPNTEPAIDSAEVVEYIRKRAEGHIVDVYAIGAATSERKGELIAPIGELVEAGAVAFSDDGVAIKTAKILRRVMEYAKMYDKPVIEHCEDETLAGGAMHEGVTSTKLGLPGIPAIAEELTVARDIMMAELTGARVHIAHISTAKAVQLVREGKAKGIKVTAEVAPHHFTLTDEAVMTYDTNAKMNPPLRTNEDVLAMISGLKDGTIDVIATDHAPHSPEEKEMEFEYAPNGILGLETAIGLTFSELVHKGHLTSADVVMKMAVNPRRILNLEVPAIKAGVQANLTVINPELEWKVDVKKFKSKSRNTPYDGFTLKGKSLGVINKNQVHRSES